MRRYRRNSADWLQHPGILPRPVRPVFRFGLSSVRLSWRVPPTKALVVGHSGPVTDQPTMPLPLPGQAQRPPAWTDAATRRFARRTLWIGLLMILIGLAAVAGCLVVVWLRYLSEDWGLWVLIAAGGIAGGALAGGVTMLILWLRTRSFLKAGPWQPGELTLDEGHEAEIAYGRSLARIRLEVRSGALGEVEDRIPVEVRAADGIFLMTVPPSRRFLRARNAG